MNRSHSQEHLYSKVSHESLRFLKVAFVIKQFLIPEILLHYPESRHFLLLTLLLKVFLFYCTYFCSLSVLNYFIILSFHQMQWFPSYLGPVLNFLSFFFSFSFFPFFSEMYRRHKGYLPENPNVRFLYVGLGEFFSVPFPICCLYCWV